MIKTTYRQHIRLLAASLLSVAALSLTSCTQTDAAGSDAPEGRITFTVGQSSQWSDAGTRATQAQGSVSFQGTALSTPLYLNTVVSDGIVTRQDAQTRGTQVNTTSQLSSFGVSAYKVGKSIVDLDERHPDYFYNLEATPNGDTGEYTVSQHYYWPSTDEKLVFYAYAPYGDPDTNDETKGRVNISAQSAEGRQTIDFAVNKSMANQVDLMTAVAETQGFNTSATPRVAMNFRHELTAVKFQLGEQFLAGGIVSITLKNVYGAGTMTINPTAYGTWDAESLTKGDFMLTLNKAGLAGTDGEQVMADGHYFFMIPQTLPDDAAVELVYQDAKQNYTVTASLKGTTWQPGTTVTYAISSTTLTTLKLGQISWPSNTEWKGPKTAFANGDEIGLYVVDGDNQIVHRNVRCTYNGSTWTIHHPQDEENGDVHTVYKLPGYQFFVYYPYKVEIETDYPLMANTTAAGTTADAFFGTIISGWTPAAKQDDEAGTTFYAQDLQVAKATDSAEGYSSTIDADMAHQMDLAIVTLGSKNIDEIGYNRTIYWLDENYSWVHSNVKGVVNNKYPITASSTFGGTYRPWKAIDGATYYYVFKPVKDMTTENGVSLLGLQADGVTSDWTETFKTTEKGKGFVREAQSARTQYESGRIVDTKSATKYTLAIGHILYSDGAIGPNRTTYSDRTPVGLVYNVTLSGISQTERNLGWTHGCAIALTPCTGSYMWASEAKNGRNPTKSKGNGFPTYKADLDGYQKTIWIKNDGNSSDYPAAYAATSYTPQVTGVSNSGWYLPSAGQIIEFFFNMSNLTESDIDQALDNDPTFPSWSNTLVYPIINSTYSMELSGCYWTSTETQNKLEKSAICALYWNDHAFDDMNSEDTEKQLTWKVLPVISF